MSSDFVTVENLINIIPKYCSDTRLTSNVHTINSTLEALVSDLKEKSFRESLPRQLFCALSCLIHSLASSFQEYDDLSITDSQDLIKTATQCFRLLRNGCAGCTSNQEAVSCEDLLLEKTILICDVLCQHQSNPESSIKEAGLVCLRCLVQFLGNAVVDFAPNQHKVWNLFKTQLSTCLQLGDTGLARYSTMVMYNCMTQNPGCVKDLSETSYGAQVTATLLELIKTQDLDWGLFILETLLKQAAFLRSIYIELSTNQRDLLLSFVGAQLEPSDQSADHVTHIHEENILYISGLFKNHAGLMLKLSQGYTLGDLEPELVMCELSILCSATAKQQQFPQLLKDRDLVKTCVNLLHCTKLLGAQEKNVFTNVQKISEQRALEHTVNPVFGLKRDLIRMLSNLAYRNPNNQDMIRELGGIQLILDHTNMDGRNPFITQWAVFAIRNLCDKNADNQAVIAGLKLEGMSDRVAELREFGVDVELKEGKLVVKRVDDATLEQPNPFSNQRD